MRAERVLFTPQAPRCRLAGYPSGSLRHHRNRDHFHMVAGFVASFTKMTDANDPAARGVITRGDPNGIADAYPRARTDWGSATAIQEAHRAQRNERRTPRSRVLREAVRGEAPKGSPTHQGNEEGREHAAHLGSAWALLNRDLFSPMNPGGCGSRLRGDAYNPIIV
jgi:hypothetical protein